MDWLSKHHTYRDCLKQKITLRAPKGKEVVHRRKPKGSGVRLIIAGKAQKVLGRGYEGYLYNVVENETPKTSLNNISVVQEFSDVFSKEILGMPLPRKVKFCIDFIPRSTPISRAPYR